MDVLYRRAVADDAAACIELRGRTRENAFSVEQLAAVGVTRDSWSAGIRDGAFPGHVASVGGALVGYCFGDRDTGEILVLALLPDYEGRGIGKRLLGLVVGELRACGFDRLFLACSADPNTRSHGFYRHLGWRPTGAVDAADDEILEFFPR